MRQSKLSRHPDSGGLTAAMPSNNRAGGEGELTLEVIGIADLPDGLGGGPGIGQGVDTRLSQGRHKYLAGEGRDPIGWDDHLAGPECRQLGSQISPHVVIQPADVGA